MSLICPYLSCWRATDDCQLRTYQQTRAHTHIIMNDFCSVVSTWGNIKYCREITLHSASIYITYDLFPHTLFCDFGENKKLSNSVTACTTTSAWGWLIWRVLCFTTRYLAETFSPVLSLTQVSLLAFTHTKLYLLSCPRLENTNKYGSASKMSIYSTILLY